MISVLVTHHKPSLEPYLDLALQSVAWQEGVDGLVRVHVLSSVPIDEAIQAKYPTYQFICDDKLNNVTKKINHWLDHLVGDATHTLMLSNDVILSKYAIARMYGVNGECIQTPLSNNENTHKYFAEMPYGGHSYDLGDVDPATVKEHNPNSSLLIRVSWLSFYTPFIPTSVWEKVGRLEPAFDKKYNDSDFCFRAGELRIPSIVNTSCYALHYVSKTTHGFMTKEDEHQADVAFQAKWPVNRVVGLLMN